MARTMKDSGIEWIGKIPSNWNLSKVKYKFYRKKDKACIENPTVLSLARSGVRIRDITTNEGQLAESYYEYNPVNIGDLLLNPMDLYSGANCSYSEVEGVISPAYINLRNYDNVCSRFYDYYFKYQYWSMAFFAHGTGVSFDNRWTLNNETLMNYPLLEPSYEEQQKIAAFLDKQCSEIDAVLTKTKESIEEYKLLKNAIITQAVTKGIRPNRKMKDSGIEWIGEIPEEWEVRKIKHEGTARNGLTYAPTDVCDEKEGTLVLRSSNIQDNKLILDDCVFVNTEIKKELFVKENDILICSRNGSAKLIGKNALIPPKLNATFGAFMLIYRCKNPLYIRYVLSSDIFSYYLGNFLTVSVNQLTIGNFNEIQFPLPQKHEQSEIVEYLDKKCSQIDTLITKKEQLITELETYKKSLIYEYVTGKKEVQ